jgi:signal transduction histidine kinase
MIRSLRFRLAIGALVAIGLALTIVWIVLSRLFTGYVVNQYMTEMTVLADSLTAAVTVRDGALVLATAPSDPRLNLPAGGRYWALEADGAILERSRSLWDTTIDEAATVPSAYTPFLEGKGPDGKPILILAQDSTIGEGQTARAFCIYAAFPKAELETALAGFHGPVRGMLVVTALLLGVAAALQTLVGLSPLARLRRKVAAIRRGALDRMGEEGPTEVGPLLREIDLLLDERDQAVERARSRASDLAHGLKTPLTVISQLAAAMDPAAADMALKQVDLIRQRADRQLQAARLGVERMVTTDVGELAGKLIQVLKPAVADRSLDWRLSVAGDVRVEADPADLAEAIGNVLDNAAKWARSEIAVDIARRDGRVEVVVADDGPGIPAEARSAMLSRGIHGEGDGGGSGLGLAITGDIAEAYGATLSLDTAAAGGLHVRLALPVQGRKRQGTPA